MICRHAEKTLLLPDASLFADLAEQADATIFAIPDEVPADDQDVCDLKFMLKKLEIKNLVSFFKSQFTFVDSIFRSSGTAPAQHLAQRERITLHEDSMMIEQQEFYQADFVNIVYLHMDKGSSVGRHIDFMIFIKH